MAKILIVDDEADICRVLQKRLKQAGYEIISAGEGYKAVYKNLSFNLF